MEKPRLLYFTKRNLTFLKKSILYFWLLLMVHPTQGQTWSEVEKVVAPHRERVNYYGYTVDLSGSYAITGAWQQSTDATGGDLQGLAGAAYLIERNGNGTWTQVKKLLASDRTAGDSFGNAVAIDNRTALVGARNERDGMSGDPTKTASGSAYFFERGTNGDWMEKQKIAPSDRYKNDNFGWTLGLSGDYAIVSAFHNDFDLNGTNELNEAGAAYFFMKDPSGTWTETQKVIASDRAAFDEFGRSVAISGDRAIVGAPWKFVDVQGAGAAYMFERDGSGNWIEVMQLVAPVREQFDNFGWSVSIAGNYAVVGAYRQNSYTGSVHVFERDTGGNWQHVQELVASDKDFGDQFGIAVSLSGEYLLVGAAGDKFAPGLEKAGAAYIFKRNGTGLWEEIQRIVASDRKDEDWFGFSVAMSGTNIISGAYLEDENALGGANVQDAGSVYIFESDQVLGLEDDLFARQIRLYPNPVLNTATLIIDGTFDDVSVHIINLQGQLIKEMNFKGRQEFSFDTTELKTGVYLVQLEAAGSVASLKLLKE